MRIFRLALTSCLHAVISTRKSHKGKWAGGEGGYKSSTTCLPLIPLVGAKVARTDQCRWISLRTYPRTYLSPPILRPRQVVNNHCPGWQQEACASSRRSKERIRARNFSPKVTKKNVEWNSRRFTLTVEKLEKKKEKKKKTEFFLDRPIRDFERMFRWKWARVREDFAYSEEAFRDYPHSNENCSIADRLLNQTNPPSLSLSSLPLLFSLLPVYRSSVFNPCAPPFVLNAKRKKRECEHVSTRVYTHMYKNIFALLPLGPPSWSSCAILFTIQLSVNSPLERRGPFVSRATHPRVRTRVARFGLHQPMFLSLYFSFFLCFSSILSVRSGGRGNGLDIGGAHEFLCEITYLRRSVYTVEFQQQGK